jgi:sulfite reductase alpha subunit-like flavoprotein
MDVIFALQSLVLFFVSTTGDGELPDNTKSFWRFLLRRDLPSNSLTNTTVAVFGLGDSSYAKTTLVT